MTQDDTSLTHVQKFNAYRKRNGRFCAAAARWARTQKSLAAAWQNCRRGSWMLWWLEFYADGYRLNRFYLRSALAEIGYTGPVTWGDMDPAQDLAFARALRKLFFYDGKRRVVRGRAA